MTLAVPPGRSDGSDQFTARLIALCATGDYPDYPDTVTRVAKQCLLDWFAVTIAGAKEPLVDILIDEALDRGAQGAIILPGRQERLGLIDAALVLGSASHALDYDDSNEVGGHITAPVASALFALSQLHKVSGKALLTAFITGYEYFARCAKAVMPGHYARGFHVTATLGTLGAAAGCCRLLQLDTRSTASAQGIAATQAAGLVASFGTMSKPLHVGRAAANGLLAARLAARGFVGRPDLLEHEQGFIHAHGPDFRLEAALEAPPAGFHILSNLFKYHAACAATHATMEAIRCLRNEGLPVADISRVEILTSPGADRVCNIPAPATGLEIKFSLRMTAAMALAGIDSGAPENFTDALAGNPELIALRDKVAVLFEAGRTSLRTLVTVILTDGTRRSREFDCGKPETDLQRQADKVSAKFTSLVSPWLGLAAAERLRDAILTLDEAEDAAASMCDAVALRTG